jgi:DNA-binding transcriptional regulator LsrR (DeoR family)
MSRRPQPTDVRLLCKVSRLYYEQDLTEQTIADRLHLSRSKVSRLLKQARAEGIVQIRTVAPPGTFPDLEAALEARYGLIESVVVESAAPDVQDVATRDVGAAAARYLQQTIRDGDVLGISWGSALRSFVYALPPQAVSGVRVVQLIGGLGPPTAETHATDLCRRLAGALDADLTLLPAPGIMQSVEGKEALFSDAHVRSALAAIPGVNLAFVGIGAPTPKSVVMRDESITDEVTRADLLARGAVGDIALRFFAAGGQPIVSDLDARVIGVTLDQLKTVERVVGVAGGPAKTAAIRGALLGRYVDVLITDHATALRLLEGGAVV